MKEIERLYGGKYQISLGTALIFENPKLDVSKWPEIFYINLRTLYRNFVNSIPVESRKLVNERYLLENFLTEVSEVERIIKEVTNNRVTPFFYYPSYKSLNKLLPATERKEYNPDGFDEIEENLWVYVKKHQLMTPFLYKDIDTELPKYGKPILLLSSFVQDLLSSYNFPKLTLIESYTGKMKTREQWPSKLRIKTSEEFKYVNAPFNRFTIQVFGDKSGALKGAPIKVRKEVRKLAEENNWSPLTTIDRIKTAISKIKDQDIKNLLKTYL